MKLKLFILIIYFPLLVKSQLVINELMPKNVSFIMDDAYNFSMWVEVYNASDTELNLSDFYFTDFLSSSNNWQPGSEVLAPGNYALLYFEREERLGHASFKLDPEGGWLYLLNKSSEIVDQVKYPETFRNISYGRSSDGDPNWVHFEQPSPGQSNNQKLSANSQCTKPLFDLKSGFYTTSQKLTFTEPLDGANIYYTLNNSEPTANSYKYVSGTSISLDTTVVVRAKAIKADKLSSDVVAATYFIKERKPNFRVVSISTDQRYLTNDTIGIYCDGTNGITGNLQKTPKNFNQDWDRPVSFEFFDEAGVSQLNQELDIRIVGGGSRESALKSLSISPKKKFGENHLNYDFFSTKPNHRYKDIMMRNSGNDYKRTMMKDAFLQSIVINRMDVDYQAYEPAVIFINGEYFGIENMRERTSRDFVYSNYGLDDEQVVLVEATYKGVDSNNDIPTSPEFKELSDFLKANPMSDSANYQKACEIIDVDEFINYMMLQIFVSNVDWPYNNVKIWRPTAPGGKWRWMLLDVEYSYSSGRIDHNSLTFALGENLKSIIGGYSSGAPEWSTVVFVQLIKNETFRNKFIDRFAIHLSSTFKPERINHIMDSMANRIRGEIPYHLRRFNIVDNFQNDLEAMRAFTNVRPDNVLKHISSRFLSGASTLNLDINSDAPGSTYLLNGEFIMDSEINLAYFKNRDFTLEANPLVNFKFKHWLVNDVVHTEKIYSGNLTNNMTIAAVFEPVANQSIKVYLNEVVTSNSLILDGFGETDDYIELYNAGADPVDISGWYISDKPNNNTKFQIPLINYGTTIIPAKGHLILWADDQPMQGSRHLGLALSADGESITLHRPGKSGLELVDEVTVPKMNIDLSYSRNYDGSSKWVVQATTWNQSNGDIPPLALNLNSDVKIYPTLATESINVDHAQGLSLRINDLNGRTHLMMGISSDHESISIEHLKPGLYICYLDNQAIRILKQ